MTGPFVIRVQRCTLAESPVWAWQRNVGSVSTSMVYVWSCLTVSPLRSVLVKVNSAVGGSLSPSCDPSRPPPEPSCPATDWSGSTSTLPCKSPSESSTDFFFFFFFCFFCESAWAFLCRYSANCGKRERGSFTDGNYTFCCSSSQKQQQTNKHPLKCSSGLQFLSPSQIFAHLFFFVFFIICLSQWMCTKREKTNNLLWIYTVWWNSSETLRALKRSPACSERVLPPCVHMTRHMLLAVPGANPD